MLPTSSLRPWRCENHLINPSKNGEARLGKSFRRDACRFNSLLLSTGEGNNSVTEFALVGWLLFTGRSKKNYESNEIGKNIAQRIGASLCHHRLHVRPRHPSNRGESLVYPGLLSH